MAYAKGDSRKGKKPVYSGSSTGKQKQSMLEQLLAQLNHNPFMDYNVTGDSNKPESLFGETGPGFSNPESMQEHGAHPSSKPNKPFKVSPKDKRPISFLFEGSDVKSSQPKNRPNPGGGGGGRGNNSGGYSDNSGSAPDNTMDYLYEYLAQKMHDLETGAGYDYESALKASAKQIKRGYHADIKAIRSNNKSARRETAKNRKGIEEMYNALAASFKQDAQDAMAQGNDLAAQMQALSADSANTVKASASDIANQQASLAEGLGIQSAMPNIMGEQANSEIDSLGDLAKMGTGAAQDQLQYAANNRDFMQRTSQGARLDGADQSAELLGSLQDYLQGNRSQIAGLKGQRARELAANRTTVLSDVADRKETASNTLFAQLMDYANFGLDREDTQFDNNLNAKTAEDSAAQHKADAIAKAKQQAAQLQLDLRKLQQGGNEDSPIPDYLQDYSKIIQGLDPEAQGVINSIVNGKNFATGKYQDGKNIFDLTPTAAGNIAVQQAKDAGITDPQTLETIRLAATVRAKGGS